MKNINREGNYQKFSALTQSLYISRLFSKSALDNESWVSHLLIYNKLHFVDDPFVFFDLYQSVLVVTDQDPVFSLFTPFQIVISKDMASRLSGMRGQKFDFKRIHVVFG